MMVKFGTHRGRIQMKERRSKEEEEPVGNLIVVHHDCCDDALVDNVVAKRG